ncbi:MAG: type IVB secretion system protein IcmV [Gammaproteobacteria bacterium]|nr:type IVB secretion system protein IcmV [Gammaproteobacteria bacterium]
MAKRRLVRRGVKSLVNVPRWAAWSDIRVAASGLVIAAKNLFVPHKAERHETFEEAVLRLKLNDASLKKQLKAFLHLAIIYLILALPLFGYALYMLIHGHIFAAILSFLLCSLLLVYAFKEHFWYTQIKQRRLGLSFKDWLHYNFNFKV